jgi:hypothetical protein
VSRVHSDSFSYRVKRQRRKSIALHVLEDATVELRAPSWVPAAELANFVESRADWVIKQRAKRLAALALQPKFAHGEPHRLLGASYPLNLLSEQRGTGRLFGGEIVLPVSEPHSPAQVEKALKAFYRDFSESLFSQRLQHCYQQFACGRSPHRPMPELKLRLMKRRWGSCTSRGVVTLNTRLIEFPLACIDYVIYHELCHLWEMNHSPRFYQLLEQAMPNWRTHQHLLDQKP